MFQLADMLSSMYGERSVPVIDKTETKGLFDFRLVLPLRSYKPPMDRLEHSLVAGRPAGSPDASVVDLRDLSRSLENQT